MKKITYEVEKFVFENSTEPAKSIYFLQKNYDFSLTEAEIYTNRINKLLSNYFREFVGIADDVDIVLKFDYLSDEEKSSIFFVNNYLKALYKLNCRKINDKILNVVQKFSLLLNTDEFEIQLNKLQVFQKNQIYISELNNKYKIEEDVERRIIEALFISKIDGVKKFMELKNISIEEANNYIEIIEKCFINNNEYQNIFGTLLFCINGIDKMPLYLEDRKIEITVQKDHLYINNSEEDQETFRNNYKNILNIDTPLLINITCNFIRFEFTYKYENIFTIELQKHIDYFNEIIKSPTFNKLSKELKQKELDVKKEKINIEKRIKEEEENRKQEIIKRQKEEEKKKDDELKQKLKIEEEQRIIKERQILQSQLDEQIKRGEELQQKLQIEEEERIKAEKQIEERQKEEERIKDEERKQIEENQNEQNKKVGLNSFTSSVTRGGDAIFPEHIYIDDDKVTWEKKTGVFSKDSKIIPIKNVTQIEIDTSLIGSKLKIYSNGFGYIQCENFTKSDVREIKNLIEKAQSNL